MACAKACRKAKLNKREQAGKPMDAQGRQSTQQQTEEEHQAEQLACAHAKLKKADADGKKDTKVQEDVKAASKAKRDEAKKQKAAEQAKRLEQERGASKKAEEAKTAKKQAA